MEMRCHFRSAQGGGRQAELRSGVCVCVCVCVKLCLPVLSHISDTDPAQDMDRLHQIQLQPATQRKETLILLLQNVSRAMDRHYRGSTIMKWYGP